MSLLQIASNFAIDYFENQRIKRENERAAAEIKAAGLYDIPEAHKERISQIMRACGLVQKVEGGEQVGALYFKAEGRELYPILAIPHVCQFEKVSEKVFELLGSRLKKEFVSFEFIESHNSDFRLVKLIAEKLPKRVNYSERPKNLKDGFWLGTDSQNKAVVVDFLHSPSMLITGASGSGKSVLGRVILEEAARQNYEIFLCDGKGGVDWFDSPVKKCFIEYKEIAKMYEGLVEEMNNRFENLKNLRCKNWIEAKEKGHSWKPVLVFMDESSDFFMPGQKTAKNYAEKWRIINAVSELCRKSRAVGIYQIFSLQGAKADSVPEDVKNNSAFRVSYALSTAAMSQTLFESSIAFDSSLRKGKGVFQGVEGEAVIFRSAILED